MPNDPSLFASIRGLSQADVEARQKTEGYNELPRPDRRTPLRIILEVVREPMLALLLGGGCPRLYARTTKWRRARKF
jgi:P-type Ca2+ transporter type 2C